MSALSLSLSLYCWALTIFQVLDPVVIAVLPPSVLAGIERLKIKVSALQVLVRAYRLVRLSALTVCACAYC